MTPAVRMPLGSTGALFAVLAAAIWLRDRSWLAEPFDAVPILAALPLAWWLGRPWRLRPPAQARITGYLIAAALMLLGLPTGWTWPLALGWCIALWSYLAPRLSAEDRRERSRLLVLAGLSFPWLLLDGQPIGWVFRLSAAALVESGFSALGYSVERAGTQLVIAGQQINVEAACAGLNSLQSMLVAGAMVAAMLLRGTRFVLAVPLLIAIAWFANTVRVFAISGIVLGFGHDAASGIAHDIAGLAILLLVFALCLGVFRLMRNAAPAASAAPATSTPFAVESRRELTGVSTPAVPGEALPAELAATTARLPSLVALLACGFAVLCSGALLRAWREAPFDRLGYVAMLIWLVPLLVCALRRRFASDPAARVPALAGLACALLGALGQLNALIYLGLAIALAALVPAQPRWVWAVWALSSCAFMPALGWLGARFGADGVFALRVALAALGAGLCLVLLRPSPPPPQMRSTTRTPWWSYALLGAAAVLAACWQWWPLHDASARLDALPERGFGYTSEAIELDPAEVAIFGNARVIKRDYRLGKLPLVLVAIDGSRNRHAVHDPRFCIRGSGFSIAEERRIAIPGGEATRLLVSRDQTQAEILFWFSDGRERHASPLRYWLHATLRRLSLGLSGEEPVLVIVRVPAGARIDWMQLADRFLPMTSL